MNPPLACIHHTLKPQLKAMMLAMYIAIVSLFSYCGLGSLLQLICTLHVSHSNCYFACSLMLLTHVAEFVTYVIYWTVGNNIGPHVIRFAASPVRIAPWPSCFNISCSNTFVLHVSDHCHSGCFLDKHGVDAKVLQRCYLSPVLSYHLTWWRLASNCFLNPFLWLVWSTRLQGGAGTWPRQGSAYLT